VYIYTYIYIYTHYIYIYIYKIRQPRALTVIGLSSFNYILFIIISLLYYYIIYIFWQEC